LSSITSDPKYAGKLDEKKIEKIWRETNMPYVVDRTRKVTFRDGKLMLFIDSAPLKQELFNSRDQIRDKVNKALDSDIVQEIVIR
ncbi:MAG TPA: DciA family protein, partial [Membranihabitans sp.]|nr:DciA family protein [Membranihabitans sp.]